VSNELLSFTENASPCDVEKGSRSLAEGSRGAIIGIIWGMVRN